MSNKQKRLQEVYEHLRRWYGIHTQIDFANSMQYSRNAISLALNGNEKYLTDSLFKNICDAYKGVFNLDYLLTGEGYLLTTEEEIRSQDIERMVNPTPSQPQAVDFNHLIDKAVEKATAYADKMISNLEKQVADKNQEIATLKARIKELEEIIRNQSAEDILHKHPFPIGVADDGSLHITVDK